MRDILVTVIVFGLLPFVLARSSIGILLFSWISYMNPHRLTWGFAYSMPFAQVVALTLIISLFTSKEKKWFPFDKTMIVWLVFIAWMTITTFYAVRVDFAQESLIQVLKIQALTLMTIVCMGSINRVNQLIWIICLSIGFYSVKGGFFTVITGGSYRVYGPPNSFLEENNALALASLMIIPLMWYLREISRRAIVRHGLMVAILLSGFSVLGSQSRGALVAIVAVGLYFWWRSSKKIPVAIGILIVSIAALSFMPTTWQERMQTIQDYQNDASAVSRIDAWKFSVNIANDRFLGGGFNSFSPATYALYNPEARGVFVAHSIYFSVLAAHGWIGLGLFLFLLFATWRSLSRTRTLEELSDENGGIPLLASCLRLSLIAFLSGGAFLSLAFFDLPWHIIAMAYLLKHIAARDPGAEQMPALRSDLAEKGQSASRQVA